MKKMGDTVPMEIRVISLKNEEFNLDKCTFEDVADDSFTSDSRLDIADVENFMMDSKD